MSDWLTAVILGLVEGITEYLPISSTGHLILAGRLADFEGPLADAFDIIVQLGSILAVVVLYRQRFIGLLKTNPFKRFSGIRGLTLLFLTSLPASLLGLFARKYIKEQLFNPYSVALSLAVGAGLILFVEAFLSKKETTRAIDEITPRMALGIGIFQCLALWPGFSRSASTILGGMILGADRKTACEYSFLAAVPIMFAATGYEIYKHAGAFSSSDVEIIGIGFVVAFLSSLAAIKWLIYMLGKMTLKPFAWYRLALAACVYLFWPK